MKGFINPQGRASRLLSWLRPGVVIGLLVGLTIVTSRQASAPALAQAGSTPTPTLNSPTARSPLQTATPPTPSGAAGTPSLPPVLPQNQPALGLIYDGLEVASQDPCRGLFRVSGTDLCTHGPDKPPPGVDLTKSIAPVVFPAGAQAASVPCFGDGQSGMRTQVIYARAANVADRYSLYLGSIQFWAAEVEQIYSQSAAETGGSRHVRFVHDANCTPVIAHVILTATGDDNFGNMVTELQAQGYGRADRKYIIFVDAFVYCGVGGLYGDDRGDSDNLNNFGPSYARADAGCWSGPVAAHEHMHTLGGVQLSAPHSSGGFHCIDEYDVMCYSDAPNNPQMQIVCADTGHENRFDCNHDDYYSANPPADSYLTHKWNAANSQFLVGGSPSDDDLCPAITGWKGKYWNNTSQSGTPAVCRNEAALNFEWFGNSPHPSIQTDGFSARWTEDAFFVGGNYKFELVHDDGAKLFIDGQIVYENWCDNCVVFNEVTLPLTTGTHTVRYEMYENIGWSRAALTWRLEGALYLPVIAGPSPQ